MKGSLPFPPPDEQRFTPLSGQLGESKRVNLNNKCYQPLSQFTIEEVTLIRQGLEYLRMITPLSASQRLACASIINDITDFFKLKI